MRTMALFISLRKHEWERPCGDWLRSQSPADHDAKTARIPLQPAARSEPWYDCRIAICRTNSSWIDSALYRQYRLFAGVMQQVDCRCEEWLYALDCGQLWYQRNVILWAAGYCFQERRAARIFGNAACAYDDVSVLPLTDHDWQLISLLQRVEAAKECYR
jgi:YARHG domain